MDILQIVVLALVQAITEFLPVSSSAHLFLASEFFGWRYEGITFDLGLHLGTLCAVLYYFRRDWKQLAIAGLAYRGGAPTALQRVLLVLLIATIPAAIGGALLGEENAAKLRHDVLIGICEIVFGLLLLVAERYAQSGARKVEDQPNVREGLLIGLAQVCSLLPGVSRSGSTMTMSLFLGFPREVAARFSFMLSVPITALIAAKGVLDVIRHPGSLQLADFLIGAVIAGVAGLACIHFLLGIVRRVGVLPFTIYRVALGLVLLGLALR
jgi:undecaprenyl-diphosphatase